MQRQDETRPFRRKDRPDLTDESPAENVERDPEAVRDDEERQRLELAEERLVARKQEREIGEAVVRKRVEEVPGRLEVEAFREEVEVEHVPVGKIVSEREEPRNEGDVLVVPVYEEQVVAVKRLVLREYIRVHRIRTTEKQVYTDTLRRDRVVVEDPDNTGQVREVYSEPPESDASSEARGSEVRDEQSGQQEGLIDRVVRKVLS